MSYADALTVLYDAVKAAAVDEGVTANIVFGKREPPKQTNQGPGRANRVVIAPGDSSGKLIKQYDVPKYPGANPRTVRKTVTLARVFVWAFDGTAPRDEKAQYCAFRTLHEFVVRAIHDAAHGNYRITGARTPKADEGDMAQLGSEMVLDLELDIPVFDTPYPEPTSTVTPAGTSVMQTAGGDVVACN